MSVETLGNYDHLPTVPVAYGLSIIVTAVVFFTVLNYNVKRLTSSADDTWKWRNLFISWIHALIVGIWDLTSFYYYPELTSDLIAFNNLYIYSLVAFSTGYFLYDFIDIVVSGRLGKMWEVVPHHVAVAGMFFYNVVESRCVAYNVVALLSEVNTIFLHSRKLLQIYFGISSRDICVHVVMCLVRRSSYVIRHNWPFDHWLYKLNSALNLLTFLSCRFLGITWIVYGMFVYYERVSRIYLWVLGAAMFVMWVTNVLLFWRLLQSDVIRPYLKGSQIQQVKGHSSDHKGAQRENVVASDKVHSNHITSMNDDYELRKRNRPTKIAADADITDVGADSSEVPNQNAKTKAGQQGLKSDNSLKELGAKSSAPGSTRDDDLEVCQDDVTNDDDRLVTVNGESSSFEGEIQSSLFTEASDILGGRLPRSNGDHDEGMVDPSGNEKASPALSPGHPAKAKSDFVVGSSPKIGNGELAGHGQA